MAAERIRVLIADDERNFRKVVSRELELEGHQVLTAENGKEALRLLQEQPVDVLLLDLNMPEMGGIELLREAQGRPDMPEVIVVTGYASVPTAIEAMKLGAYDYLTKPCQIERLNVLIRKAYERRRLARENFLLRAQREPGRGVGRIVTASPRMMELLVLVRKVAAAHSEVLVQGESGTGKELVAQAVHEESPRAEGPFVPVHCGALPRELLESELFGHERGAFTGAQATKPGFFELAHRGTLFLDEIAEMALDQQVKLLRAIEAGSFYRVGGTAARKVDLRIVAATNQNLAELVQQGRFRQDLYYRINTVTLAIPPLRERPEDIPLLAQHFLMANGQLGRKEFAAEALELLQRYPWPGNVRELLHVVQRAIILAPGHVIEPEDLPLELQAPVEEPAPEPGSLGEMERQQIVATLRQVGGHRGKAAAILGIDRKTLYRKVLAYKIRPEMYTAP